MSKIKNNKKELSAAQTEALLHTLKVRFNGGAIQGLATAGEFDTKISNWIVTPPKSENLAEHSLATAVTTMCLFITMVCNPIILQGYSAVR